MIVKEIKLTVSFPETGATEYQIQEYLEFHFHYNGSMSQKNPLCEEGEPEVLEMDID